jgi:hypothetical protein
VLAKSIVRVSLQNFLNPLSAKKAQREADPAMMEILARIARDSFVFIPEQVQRQLLDDADHVRLSILHISFETAGEGNSVGLVGT